MPDTAAVARAKAFLPELKAANAALPKEPSAEGIKVTAIDSDDGSQSDASSDTPEGHIEMEVAAGVFEERKPPVAAPEALSEEDEYDEDDESEYDETLDMCIPEGWARVEVEPGVFDVVRVANRRKRHYSPIQEPFSDEDDDEDDDEELDDEEEYENESDHDDKPQAVSKRPKIEVLSSTSAKSK
ncbi:uncharacterized protein L969DRAFT_56594 [Mixia osmundae IAM 14324]|uniref:Uncharacterized protein n=1 Tax=Mixia osmundae (strain CBS 9802 / IAM 14324 / JCM 22182 / KY 12970) TaxID=764103 RepID=G7E073_MIXOS|nr:uncharacterized protein L969DRAFT_56594 [Mixia osmundae IAM 14324]KEI42223.1 hypothetical protein L969DRAFT_56594 [Mixia osmundae IAM 14324]GAA96233.1 hypothetical protein E5Q_02897 [Mixia osmundae IAM 14324]